MRIGIDCRHVLNPGLGEWAGIGHYTYELAKHVVSLDRKNEYVLFFDYRMPDVRAFEGPNVRIKRFPFSHYRKFLPFTYSHMLVSAYLLKTGLNVMHIPAGNVPLTYPKKIVYTVHDLAIYKNPAWFPSQIISTRFLVPQSLRKADRIIAVSESTKRDLQEIFNVRAKKIRVIYEGANVEKIPLKSKRLDRLSRFKLPKQFFLFVGTIEPRKNLLLLLQAYKRLLTWGEGTKTLPFLFAGHRGHKADEVFDKIRELRLGKHVRYLGYLTHNEKIGLLKRATCFVFPSLYEGFGLPVLEAMALGTPVITSTVSSLPEVADRAALLVDPGSEEEIAEAMRKIMTDPVLQERLSQHGKERAKVFSWERCARETVKVYRTFA